MMYEKLSNGVVQEVTQDQVIEVFEAYYSNFRNEIVRNKMVNKAMSEINKGKLRIANGSFYRKVNNV